MKNQAKESRQIEKARGKLQKRLEWEHQKFTSDALHEIANKIRNSMVRHPHPEFLSKRKITSKEPESRSISKLRDLLQVKPEL